MDPISFIFTKIIGSILGAIIGTLTVPPPPEKPTATQRTATRTPNTDRNAVTVTPWTRTQNMDTPDMTTPDTRMDPRRRNSRDRAAGREDYLRSSR